MCYKVATPKQDILREYLVNQGISVNNYPHYYHADGFGNPLLPLTTSEAPDMVQPGMWKLLPHWVKTEAEAKKYANTLNATSEDIFEKASFKLYVQKQRCLVWVEGFFEPHHPSAKVTIPYYIKMLDGNPMSLGGVYSNWLNHDTGEVIITFTITTTPANELMSRIHNDKKRMPLIIAPEVRNRWLGKLSREEITEMMHPLPDGLLNAYAVSNLVYKKGIDANVPEITLPVGAPSIF